ncbi:Putative ribonuclease H protein At1g65750 [Linum perenne]
MRILPTGALNEDTMIWNVNPEGSYSVKSAYKEVMEQRTELEQLRVQGPWKNIWDSHLPPKTKHFAWRVGRGILPLRKTLLRQRLAVPVVCGLCNGEEETEMHLFGHCEMAEDCWKHAGLWSEVRLLLTTHDNFTGLMQDVMGNWSTDKSEKWITVLWSICFFST